MNAVVAGLRLPLLLFCLLQPTAWPQAQVTKPHVTAASVLPSWGNRPEPLGRGMLFSIYGQNLGPVNQHCNAQKPYPTELCGRRVILGGVDVPLLYVGERQINFQVPDSVPQDGNAPLIVIRGSVASDPVDVPLGQMRATVRLDEPALAGMPVWLHVDLTYSRRGNIRYPLWIHPWEFLESEVEVRREGRLLSKLPFIERAPKVPAIGGFLGLPAEPRHKERLPLHLQYAFDQPGTYEVRYTLYRQSIGESRKLTLAVVDQSEWTPIDIQPSTAAMRDEAFAKLVREAPSDTAELLSDFLPTILAWRDAKAEGIIRHYANSADSLVAEYSRNALAYFGGPVPTGVFIGSTRNWKRVTPS